MASENIEVSNLGIIVLLLLGWFWWARNRKGGTSALGSGAQTPGNCGCHGVSSLDGPPVVQGTASANGTQPLTGAVTTTSGLRGPSQVLIGGNAPGNAPGWQRGGAGSGGNWTARRSGVRSLNPADVPNQPASPVGSGVWIGDTKVARRG